MLRTVSRQTYTDQITESLVEYIASSQVQPGDLLPSTADLATQFGVSRPVVREALKALEGQGLIQIVNGKGALVRPVSGEALQSFFGRAVHMNDDAIFELVEVRQPLEVQSAMLAAARRSDAEITDLCGLLAAMREHLTEFEVYADLDVEFHLRVAAAARNQMLYFLIASIRGTLHAAALAGLQRRQNSADLERVQERHEAILTAIAAGNAEAAGDAMRGHFAESVAGLVSVRAPTYPQMARP